MNRRTLFGAIAALFAGPVSLRAYPIEGRLKKALALSNVPRTRWTPEEVRCLRRRSLMPVITNDECWRIPEWQEKWIAAGMRGAYIHPNDPDELPHYKEALKAAIAAGTAVRVS